MNQSPHEPEPCRVCGCGLDPLAPVLRDQKNRAGYCSPVCISRAAAGLPSNSVNIQTRCAVFVAVTAAT